MYNYGERKSAAFRILCIALCLLLGYSSAAAGINATSTGIYLLLKSQVRPPHFSDSPRAVQFGDNPKREDSLRGGQWTLATLEALKRAAAEWAEPGRAGLVASTSTEANLDIGYPGDEGSGDNNPWEGEYVFPIGLIAMRLNTQTGNAMTPFGVTGWASRGDLGIGLTLYHNSKSSFNGLGASGWSHSYSALVSGSYGENVVLRWGDGTSHAYTFNDGNGSYAAPVGVFDKLAHVGDFWILTNAPKAGDIIAFVAESGSGHSGLKVGPGLLIYAGEPGVKLGTFGDNWSGKTRWGGRRHRRQG